MDTFETIEQVLGPKCKCEDTKPHIVILTDKKQKRLDEETKGMFGNCFFPLFSVFKNNFLFLRLKNLFDNSKRVENKNCFQNLICEGN